MAFPKARFDSYTGGDRELRCVRTQSREQRTQVFRPIAEARRWQFQQAYATWDRFRRGEGRTVPREQIDQIFTDALAQRNRVTRSR